nr:hypothetical protein [Candidatus Anoxychlamydiales bacterium]
MSVFSLSINGSHGSNSNEILPKIVSSSGLGYLTARLFTSINPAHAAVFHGVAELTNLLVYKLLRNNISTKPSVGYGISTAISYTVAFFALNYYAKFALVSALVSTAFVVISQIALNILYKTPLV